MGLPTHTYPIFTTTIPSTKQKISFRPFLVSEQKSLLIADETQDFDTMAMTVKEVLKNTIQDDIDIDNLASVDIEYLFTQVRAKSVGEIVELRFGCTDECTDIEKSFVIIPVDLTEIEVDFPVDFSDTIQLSDNMWMKMKLPTIDAGKYIVDADDQDADLKVIASCIETIYTKDELWNMQENSTDEILNFIRNLTTKQFDEVEKFFHNMPVLHKVIEWDCPVCKRHNVREIRGLKDFFL